MPHIPTLPRDFSAMRQSREHKEEVRKPPRLSDFFLQILKSNYVIKGEIVNMSLRYILSIAIIITVFAQFLLMCGDSIFQFIHGRLNGTLPDVPELIKKGMGHIVWATIGGIYAFFALAVAIKLLEGLGVIISVRFSILIRVIIPLIEISTSLLPLWIYVIGGNQPTSTSCVKQENHLILQLLAKKKSDNLITHISLLLAFIGEYILYIQAILYTRIQETSLLWMIMLTVFLFCCNFIKQRILQYRVAHGLYGTCYSEAKEIVAFILDWQRKNGDLNGKPPKLVFVQEEIDQCLQVNGGEEYAG